MFGMTAKYLMGLAYEVAVAHGIRKFSDVKKSVGRKWYYNFMRKHPNLSLRSPEPTSLARAARFNREAVYNSFDLLEKLIDEHNFTPTEIYKVDEIGHSTVQIPSKVGSGDGSLSSQVQGSGDGGLSSPVQGLGDGDLSSPVPGSGDGGLSSPVQGSGDGGISSPVQRLDCGVPYDPVQGSGDDGLSSPMRRSGVGGLSSPVHS